MKIHSGIPENGSHHCADGKKQKKKQKNICKTYTHPRHLAAADA